MGLKKPAGKPDGTASGRSAAKPDSGPTSAALRPPDTVVLSRRAMAVPQEAPGEFLGMLEGLRCFNCSPQIVQIGLSDTMTRDAGYLSMRVEAWNSIERPVRDRRIFDYHNQCFFFGQKERDTVILGGELAEIRHHQKPCYPYLQKVLRKPAASLAPAPAPAPAPGAEPVGPPREPAPPAGRPSEPRPDTHP